MEEVHDINYARKLIKENLTNKNPYLDLGNCGLMDLGELPELFECKHLEVLILAHFWLDDKYLYKGSKNYGLKNQIKFINQKFSNLNNLKKLILNQNPILDIKYLEKLTKLKLLNVYDCQLTTTGFLKTKVNLEHLNAGANYFTNHAFLQNLSNLKTLNLDKSNVNPNNLKNLFNLERLSLKNCNIQNCDFLHNLNKITHLNLTNNPIKNHKGLQSLKKIKNLELHNNALTDISFLEQLSELKILGLNNNNIENIQNLKKLNKLEHLHLRNNKIKEIPFSIFSQYKTYSLSENYLYGLCLYGNPIQSPPQEILRQGRKETKAWYIANKVKLNEIKVILIGDPKTGKTSLLRKLKDDIFYENEEQTDGVNIESLIFGKLETFKKQKTLHELTGHFWDFGGQEIMNATHQFFLTKRCIYVLVLDARKDTNVPEQIRKWVNKIKTTGGNSSIVIVSNKVDINSGFGFENEYDLQKDFPQIKYFIKTSSKTNEGIKELKNKLAELIPQSELFNTEIDKRWIPIKEQLKEETKKKYKLNEERFINICKEHGLEGKSERQSAIRFLNDLGIVLHFEDIKLAEYYVLDPYWITYGIYQIITSKFAGEQKGKIAMDKLDFIINEEEDKETVYRPSTYKKIPYSSNERRFLVDILQQFKLSFTLRDECHFILPDLLDTKEPKVLTVPIRDAENTIQFVYEYAYLPKAILPYIMVETHEIMVANWRTGCVLQNTACKALISSYDNKLRIIVDGQGTQKREFMSVIRYVIDTFNNKLTHRPSMHIPLPYNLGSVNYEELIMREKFDKLEYTIFRNDVMHEFKISQLLNGISPKEEVNNSADSKLNQILENQKIIMKKFDSNTEFLYQKLGEPKMEGELHKAIFQLNQEQQLEISSEITTKLANIFSGYEAQIEDQFKSIYQDLQKSDHTDVKLKLGIPLISLLGIQLEADFDVKSWFKELSVKYNLKALIPFT